MRGPFVACILLLVSAHAEIAVAGAAEDDLREQKRAFFKLIGRPPLGRRAHAIWKLARTEHPDAFRILASRYGTAKTPVAHERFIIVSACAKYFRGKEHVDAWLSWASRKPKDPWLSFHALSVCARHEPERVLKWARKPRRLLSFAAAMEAMAGEPGALEMATAMLGQLPRQRDLHAPIIEACTSVMLAQSADRTNKAFVGLGSALVDRLNEKSLPSRTKLTIARRLARAYDAPVSLDARDWRRWLGFEALGEQKGPTRTYRSKFAGVRGSGTRIAYLIDLSDSMTTPVSEKVRENLKVQAISRFDLARSFLIESIRNLPNDAVFTVVGFGTRAIRLRTTPGLVRATPDRVGAVIAELKAIKVGKPSKERPNGTLRGATNLHGALLLGFQAKFGGSVARLEHSDPEMLKSGCDTMYILSDGEPNQDNFAALDRGDGGSVTTDTEAGTTRKARAGIFEFYGPYAKTYHLLHDLRRLNLYRKVEIHCVGLGEANDELLRDMAKLGLGRFRTLEAAPD